MSVGTFRQRDWNGANLCGVHNSLSHSQRLGPFGITLYSPREKKKDVSSFKNVALGYLQNVCHLQNPVQSVTTSKWTPPTSSPNPIVLPLCWLPIQLVVFYFLFGHSICCFAVFFCIFSLSPYSLCDSWRLWVYFYLLGTWFYALFS